MHALSLVCLIGIAIIDSAAASTILVPSVQPTIQAGINAAVPGDTVQVAPGTYTGPFNRNLDFGGKNIVLRSSAGAATTIIDCQDLARGIRFHAGETSAAVVQGFTIRNGLASGTFGGGILIESGARPTIRNCRFQTNHANTGGGVFVSSGVTLTDCDFEANSADNFGGAIYGEGGNVQATRCSFTGNEAGIGAGIGVLFGATLTLSDCILTENIPANLGGGVYATNSTVSLQRCTFENHTGKHGAGAFVLNGSATVDSCAFTSNTANYSGGGLHAEQVDPLAIRGCSFVDNTTLAVDFENPRGGGGLLVHNQPDTGPHLTDCVFIGNRALGEGAGGGGMTEQSNALIERCTFIGNYSDFGGGAQASGSVRNCIFEGNTSPVGAGLYTSNEVIDCRFTNNHAETFGGGCRLSGSGTGKPSVVLRCEFSGNSAGTRGGGLYRVSQFTGLMMEDSEFLDNSSLNGGGAYLYCGGATSVAGCTFAGNSASQGAAIEIQGPAATPPVIVSGSTFVANGASIAGGVKLGIPVEIVNTIIAFGTQGEAIACSGAGVGVMSCTDIFGNAGGNWTACISDQLGINGNFSLDPLFCNRASRDFTLAQSSPCTAANAPAGCGLIGAYPVGCANPIGIADVGAPAVTPILRVTPNPVRGSGMIEWSGVGRRETELRLFDVAGRLVARRSEASAVGRMPWSSLVGGSGVASGVYFLEVGAEHSTDMRVRLVVIR